MTKTYLKQIADLTNNTNQGRRSKLVDSVAYFKDGSQRNRMSFQSINAVYNEIIYSINLLLENNEKIKPIKSFEYSIGIYKHKKVMIDFEELTINGEKIPQEQLNFNTKVKPSKVNIDDIYFHLA